MPRANVIDRKFVCETCNKSYSYQSGLSYHNKMKHPELHESKLENRGTSGLVLKLKPLLVTVSPAEPASVAATPVEEMPTLEALLGENGKSEMRKLMETQLIKEFLIDRSSDIEKGIGLIIVTILKDNCVIRDGMVQSVNSDFAQPMSDDIFRTLIDNFVHALDNFVFDYVDKREDHILLNLWQVNHLKTTLSARMPFLILDLRKLAERQLRIKIKAPPRHKEGDDVVAPKADDASLFE